MNGIRWPRGSEWRKWDLHFHTPSSFDYQNKSVTNDEIVDVLIAARTAAVAITDHHVIDVQRIVELQKFGAKQSRFPRESNSGLSLVAASQCTLSESFPKCKPSSCLDDTSGTLGSDGGGRQIQRR